MCDKLFQNCLKVRIKQLKNSLCYLCLVFFLHEKLNFSLDFVKITMNSEFKDFPTYPNCSGLSSNISLGVDDSNHIVVWFHRLYLSLFSERRRGQSQSFSGRTTTGSGDFSFQPGLYTQTGLGGGRGVATSEKCKVPSVSPNKNSGTNPHRFHPQPITKRLAAQYSGSRHSTVNSDLGLQSFLKQDALCFIPVHTGIPEAVP